jgi:hypothetical protein
MQRQPDAAAGTPLEMTIRTCCLCRARLLYPETPLNPAWPNLSGDVAGTRSSAVAPTSVSPAAEPTESAEIVDPTQKRREIGRKRVVRTEPLTPNHQHALPDESENPRKSTSVRFALCVFANAR